MPDDQTPQPLNQPWTAERIREYMRTEHNVNWAPPPVKDTWKEGKVGQAPLEPDTADEWVTFDKETKQLRVLSTGELMDLSAAVEATMPDSMRESATRMLADPDAHATPDTVEGIARAGGVTQEQLDQWKQQSAYGNDLTADIPRDHPRTDREARQLDAVMKEHGVAAETRAQLRWGDRMNPEQSRAQQMAQITHHPSALPAIRPVVS